MDIEFLFQEEPTLINSNISRIISSIRTPTSEAPVKPKKIKVKKNKIEKRDMKYTVICPTPNSQQTIKLNEQGTAFLTIDYLPQDLINQGYEQFDKMWGISPQIRHKVIMFEKQIQVHRFSKSYMHTPTDLSHVEKSSYMYSGYDTTQNNEELPQVFEPFYKHMKSHDPKYNQAIVNWYKNQNDYIAQHSDCQRGMIQDAKISVISFYPCNDSSRFRYLMITPKHQTKTFLHDILMIRMDQGMILTMHGTTQDQFRHGMRKEKNPMPSRISLSFRQMK